VAGVEDAADGGEDGVGGGADFGGVSPGPAGDVGEGVAAGVYAVSGGDDVCDGLGLNLTAATAEQVGGGVGDVAALNVPELVGPGS
jgi:hypothetical protein